MCIAGTGIQKGRAHLTPKNTKKEGLGKSRSMKRTAAAKGRASSQPAEIFFQFLFSDNDFLPSIHREPPCWLCGFQPPAQEYSPLADGLNPRVSHLLHSMRCPRFPPDVDVGGDKDEEKVERRSD
jgi:hypothetical protein